MASKLRVWMRKEEVYDVDFEQLLTEAGIENPPDDFKNLTQKQFDELVRKGKVERFKELKDQKARNRLEKKIKKIEKIWRQQSGIKSTSIKKGGKKSGSKKDTGTKADKAKKEALSSNIKLKKFMQKNAIWEIELFLILTELGCKTGDDFKDIIKTNDDFDDVYRKVRVKRAKTLKDNDAKLRMEKLMTKFEKLWRKQSGIKKTSQTKKTKKKDGKKKGKNPKDNKADELSGKGKKLKQWMRKNNIWEKQLYEELIRNNIEDNESLKTLNEDDFDNIIRVVRVEKFKELKDSAARNRADKLLVKFEKLWRKESGIVKTSMKKKKGKSGKKDKKKDDAKDNDDNKKDEEPKKEEDEPKEEEAAKEEEPKEEDDAGDDAGGDDEDADDKGDAAAGDDDDGAADKGGDE